MESNPCIVEPGQCIEEDVRFRFPCNVVMVGSTVHKVAVVVAVIAVVVVCLIRF